VNKESSSKLPIAILKATTEATPDIPSLIIHIDLISDAWISFGKIELIEAIASYGSFLPQSAR